MNSAALPEPDGPARGSTTKEYTFAESVQNRAVGPQIAEIFSGSDDSVETRLSVFPRYARRLQVSRFITLYELFKLCLPLKGSIVECGVFRGFSLMTWAHLSSVMEPNNLNRRIYGFDSFTGFPSVSGEDDPDLTGAASGQLASHSKEELDRLIDLYDQDRFLGHIPKVQLIDGDVVETVPRFVAENQHLVVALLLLDMDIFEPTVVALRHFLPRLHRGSILAFDELDRPDWPGETLAALKEADFGHLRLRRFEWDPHIAYAVME